MFFKRFFRGESLLSTLFFVGPFLYLQSLCFVNNFLHFLLLEVKGLDSLSVSWWVTDHTGLGSTPQCGPLRLSLSSLIVQ